MKTCSKCKQTRPITDFPLSKQKKCGRNSICKICMREYGKRRYNRRNEYFRYLERKFNFSQTAYENMLLLQNGKCAICNLEKSPLCLDHCHTTGKVRGLLCRNCNGVLGRFGDDIKRFETAALYLKKAKN